MKNITRCVSLRSEHLESKEIKFHTYKQMQYLMFLPSTSVICFCVNYVTQALPTPSPDRLKFNVQQCHDWLLPLLQMSFKCTETVNVVYQNMKESNYTAIVDGVLLPVFNLFQITVEVQDPSARVCQ